MSASSSFRRGGRGLLERSGEAEMGRLGTGTVAMRRGGRGMSAVLEMGRSSCRIGRTMIVVRRLGSFYRILVSLRLILQRCSSFMLRMRWGEALDLVGCLGFLSR